MNPSALARWRALAVLCKVFLRQPGQPQLYFSHVCTRFHWPHAFHGERNFTQAIELYAVRNPVGGSRHFPNVCMGFSQALERSVQLAVAVLQTAVDRFWSRSAGQG